MYISRIIENTITKASEQFPVVLVTGPRQVGKTTVLKKLNDNKRKYVTLDNPADRALAKRDPELFMQKHKPPVIIDEVQYAPELFSYIKMYVDKSGAKGDIWLTGSQMFILMKNVSESLAGRVAIITLLGMSNREMVGDIDRSPFLPDKEQLYTQKPCQIGVNELFENIFNGSLPAIATKQVEDRELYLYSYIQTYLQRDLRDLANVGDEASFYTFLQVIAARTSQMLNMSEVASEVGVSAVTIKKWISILEASGMIYVLKPYHNNMTKRLVKTPKIYFLDTGLCCYLCGWESPEVLERSIMAGAMMETYVIGEVLKSYYNLGRHPNIFYYRDKDKKEIDIVLETNMTLYPIEIKKSAAINTRYVNVFSVLNKTKKQIGEGAVICLYPEVHPIDEKNTVIPVGMI